MTDSQKFRPVFNFLPIYHTPPNTFNGSVNINFTMQFKLANRPALLSKSQRIGAALQLAKSTKTIRNNGTAYRDLATAHLTSSSLLKRSVAQSQCILSSESYLMV